MAQMHLYKVGERYNPNRASWPDALQYNWRSGVHELVIFHSRLTVREIAGIRSGPGELALVVQPPALFLCFQFPGALDWSDAVYSYHLVPPEQQQLPPMLGPTEGILLPIMLVDGADGVLKAIRIVTLPPTFAAALHDAIRAQATAPWDAAAYDQHLQSLYAQYPSVALQKLAVARVKIGRDEGRMPNSTQAPG